MAAVAALLSLCFGALTSCPSDAGPHCIAELARGEGPTRRIVVSHDGTLAAVVGESGLQVYTVSTGDALTVPDYNSTSDVAFSPDADRVAVTLWDTVAVVNLTDGTELWSQKRDCSTVAYSPDGTRVVSGHPAQGISIFNAATGDFELTIPVYSAYTLAYTPDGGNLLGGWTKGTVVTWKVTTGAVLKTLPEYTGGITTDIRVSPDGLYFATIFVFTTHTVNIYKLSDYTLHKRIPNLRGTRDLSFSQDSSKLVVVGWGDMKVYSVETGGLLESHAMPSLTSAVAYFHTSDTIITGEGNSNDSRILLWADLATLAPPTPAPATPAPPTPAPATAAPPTGTPPPALPAARICTEDDTCRVFGDATANCKTSQHCACGTHSGPLCEIPVAGPAPVDVIMSVAITLRVPCDRAGLQDLLEALSAAATVRGARAVSVGASCGTLSVAVSGTVPGATIATTADTLVDALGAAALAHSNLTKVTHASQLNPFAQTTQTSGRNTTPVCTQDALNTVQTYDGRCLVLSCKDGFAVSVETRAHGKDYHTCTTTAVDTPVPRPVSTPAPIPDAGDDGLSAGAIAGIVAGSVVAVAVLVAVMVWCVRRAPASQQQQEQEMSYKNQPAGV